MRYINNLSKTTNYYIHNLINLQMLYDYICNILQNSPQLHLCIIFTSVLYYKCNFTNFAYNKLSSC